MLFFALRMLPLFAVIAGLALALGAYMTFSGVRGAYLDLIDSRMAMVAEDVGTVVEAAVSVGIPPAEQVTLPALLDRQAEADPLIRAIEVRSPDGAVLFGSAAGPAPDTANGGEDPGAGAVPPFHVARPVLNDFGVAVADIRVRYDSTVPGARIAAFGRGVLADAVPAGIAAALAGSLAAMLVLSRLHGRAGRLAVAGGDDPLTTADREVEAALGGDAAGRGA
ncbi:MAG: hypothetical protein GVY13_02665 [Alphaproteobacteria bacterium]|jgi:hypothetical protein|nr:hypothetical protein [Alphaproteobacteria bacterium]